MYWNSRRESFERDYAETQRHIDGVMYPWPCEPWASLQGRFSFHPVSLWSPSLTLPALFSVQSETMDSWLVFHCPFHCGLWNLSSPCTDLPESQEWFQFNFKVGGLLHRVLFRHVTFLVRMTCYFHFHFSVEKTETRSDFSKVQLKIICVDRAYILAF